MEDQFLIKQVLGGHRDAFQFLVLRYQRPLFGFLTSFKLSPQVVDEIAQETFLRAYQNLSTYDSQKGASFSSWLFVIGKNLALNELARHHCKNELLVEEENALYGSAPDLAPLAEESIDAGLSKGRLSQALEALPVPFRTALALSYFEDLSLEEVASIEGCSVGTVKSRVFRGKNLLRIALGSKEAKS